MNASQWNLATMQYKLPLLYWPGQNPGETGVSNAWDNLVEAAHNICGSLVVAENKASSIHRYGNYRNAL